MKRLGRIFLRGTNWLGPFLILLFVVTAVLAQQIAPRKDFSQLPVERVGRATDQQPHPPSREAPLGTLPGQYNIFFTLVWGTREALAFGLQVTLFSAFIGVIYGASSAYLGKGWNRLLMRVADAFLTFPVIAAIVFISQIVDILLVQSGIIILGGEPSLLEGVMTPFQEFLLNINPVLIALVLFSWMPYARLVNVAVLRFKQTEYIQAARALGAGHLRIIFRHLLPNAVSPAMVLAARDVGGMVILQATFTFIGMGGGSYWGTLLSMGRSWVIGPGGNPLVFWWTFLPVTIALVLFSVSWNLVGDSLNEWLDPRIQ